MLEAVLLDLIPLGEMLCTMLHAMLLVILCVVVSIVSLRTYSWFT